MQHKDLILDMRDITKVFPGVKALDRVQLQLRKGEVHALIGENGAGKSTLMKILLGIYQPEEGEIYFKGQKVFFANPHAALTQGISMIHQEISLIPSVDVAENIWIGREQRFSQCGILSKRKRYQATRELLERLGIPLNPTDIVHNLSVANMQLVEIARAVSYDSDIIIMDEPTSALTEAEITILYKIIRDLAAQGVTIVFISHKLEEIFEVCDRITVFRDGQYIATHDSSAITKDQLITLIVGREVNELYPKEEADITDIMLEVKGLCSAKKFKDVSFAVRKGEILGFCGLMGAGRTEIMRAIFGIDPYTAGQVYLDGKPVRFRSPKQAIAQGLGMVTEDRLRMGAIHRLSVKENITLAYLRTISQRMGFINFSKENKDSAEVIKKLAVKTASPNQAIGSLSGGNQQKAIIAKWLLTNPRVLILDEPTRGIDVGSKSEIHRLISRLAQQGMAIILISSELSEVMGMSDRMMVVRGGQIVAEYQRGEVDQETLIKDAFGA